VADAHLLVGAQHVENLQADGVGQRLEARGGVRVTVGHEQPLYS